MSRNDFDILSGDVVRVTDKAVLIECVDNDGESATVWVPRSVIEYGEDVCLGLKQDLAVKSWFLTKENLL